MVHFRGELVDLSEWPEHRGVATFSGVLITVFHPICNDMRLATDSQMGNHETRSTHKAS